MSTTITANTLFPRDIDIPLGFQYHDALNQREYLINGKLERWNAEQQLVYSPVCIQQSNNEPRQVVIGSYPLMDEKTALHVLSAAEKSFDKGRGNWATMNLGDRVKYFNEFTARLKDKKKEIVYLLMWEIGKSYKDSVSEFDRTIENLNDTVEELKKLDHVTSEIIYENNMKARIRKAPIGIVLCMGPFNFPLNESFATIIPALAMGNSVIFKPPKHGVLLHHPILEIFRDIFPPGVVNTIYGSEEDVVKPILSTGKINVLAFIGTSKAANILKTYHPKPNRLKEIYGLEAKNPAIIMEDADLDFSVNECLKGALSFNGQRCTALKILYVHRSLVDRFLEKFHKQVEGLKVGMPWEKEVMITPLPQDNKVEYLNELVNDAQNKGADIQNRRGGIWEKTVFYPTVLYPVDSSMRIYHEEQFGPVVPVVSFDDIDEPMEYIINSRYGQQVSIFSNNSENLLAMISPILNQVARVNINSLCQRGPDFLPFTGRKDSAKGTLSNSEALREFSLNTLVSTIDNGNNLNILKNVF